MNTISKIMIALKVEDESKARMYKRLKEIGIVPICGRCGGSGKYAYNMMDGTICYGCSGAGIIWKKSYDELLTIVQLEENQNKLNTYLKELEEAKTKKNPKQVKQVESTEDKPAQTKLEMTEEMKADAIEREDWEFVFRLNGGLRKLKPKENNPATEKQFNYITTLSSKCKKETDKANLLQMIEDHKNGNYITKDEANAIINWLK